jgi:flagellar export protein FliJ
MKTLRFGRIRRLKTQQRKVVGDELATLRQNLAAVERAMAEAAAALDGNRAEAARAAADGVSAIDLHLRATFEAAQTACRQRLREQALALDRAIEDRRDTLLARRREERQFELLEAGAKAREAEVEARADTVLQDDLARRPRATTAGEGATTGATMTGTTGTPRATGATRATDD